MKPDFQFGRIQGKRAAAMRRGFTLIELVMVMALIGLLLSLAVPRYFTSVEQGKARVRQQNIATMRDALDKFFSDQGRYPDTLAEMVEKRYLREVPTDPITGAANWRLVAPTDPALGGIYDVRIADEVSNETQAAQ